VGRPRRRVALTVINMATVIGMATVLAACGDDGPSFGAPRPASHQGEDIFRLWQGSVWAAGFVGAFVWGLIIFAVIRFRKRGDELPPQRHANIPLEIAYTVTPLLIVAGLFAFTVATQERVTDIRSGPADLTVEVTAFQWQWRFHYKEAGIDVVGTPDEDPVMVLPTGATVRLDLRSTDVQHSFYVPAFLFKRDTVPGITNVVDLEVVKPGRYDGRCAEFCGLLHDRMDFVVEAVDQAEFDRWVAEQTRTRPAPATEAVR
ncbi:MAG: aa3-type cytochrome oxidase subunit II, partial [Acidimicrobiales bacterium]